MRDFYGCYLLVSRSTNGKGRTYIGFTVNPRRRIRQHNGEIMNGASKTKRFRPWEMVLVVYGFATQVQALQFEWAWQHPSASTLVRDIYRRVGKSKTMGLKGKIRLLMEMLNVPPWSYYPLTLQILSSEHLPLRDKCPDPPSHMSVSVAPLEALPSGVEDDGNDAEAEEDEEQGLSSGAEQEAEPGSDAHLQDGEVSCGEPLAEVAGAKLEKGHRPPGGYESCRLCEQPVKGHWLECSCGCQCHVDCLANHFLEGEGECVGSMPTQGTCPECGKSLTWLEALSSGNNIGWKRMQPKKSPKRRKKAVKAEKGTEEGSSPAKKPRGKKAAAGEGLVKAGRGRKTKVEDGKEAGPAAEVKKPRKKGSPRGRKQEVGEGVSTEEGGAPRGTKAGAKKKLDVSGAAEARSPAKARGRAPQAGGGKAGRAVAAAGGVSSSGVGQEAGGGDGNASAMLQGAPCILAPESWSSCESDADLRGDAACGGHCNENPGLGHKNAMESPREGSESDLEILPLRERLRLRIRKLEEAAAAETPPKMRQMVEGFDSVTLVSAVKPTLKSDGDSGPPSRDSNGSPVSGSGKVKERSKRLRTCTKRRQTLVDLTASPVNTASPLPLRRRLLQESNQLASDDTELTIAEEVIVVSD